MITFWFILTAAALLWYSSITIYVSIKGARDIREMLDIREMREMVLALKRRRAPASRIWRRSR